ncbi:MULTISPECIES: hypothetical protein [Microbacterium]|jgi:hypothetical protein|uniref:hypothetical protein n=1 Tax=Microbacterium TaxID=33882 RepID=UPI002613826E|nr:hypothetical protein [Microbacterium sp.]
MDISRVDPRDAAYEMEDPVYRVYFSELGATDEWQLEGASSVIEVIDWARADGREFTAYVETGWPSGMGLLRVFSWAG